MQNLGLCCINVCRQTPLSFEGRISICYVLERMQQEMHHYKICKWIFQPQGDIAWCFTAFKPLTMFSQTLHPFLNALFWQHLQGCALVLHVLALSVSQKLNLRPAAIEQTGIGSIAVTETSCMYLWPGVKIFVLNYKWTRNEECFPSSIFVGFPCPSIQ